MILLTGDLGKADLARKRHFENVERKRKGLEENKKFVKEVYIEIHNSTINLLRYLSKYSPVYIIRGNVGIPTLSQVRKIMKKHHIKTPRTRKVVGSLPNVYLVKNKLRLINGLRIGFLEYFVDNSWVREFRPQEYLKQLKNAKRQTHKAKRILNKFGKGLDILVCHQPPYGILDKANFPGAPKHYQGKHAGSKAILNPPARNLHYFSV